MKKIEIYSKNRCPYCVKAKRLFESKNVEFHEYLIDEDPKFLEQSLQRSGGMKTVPQIFIDDFHVGGCDDLYELESQGKLDPLLER